MVVARHKPTAVMCAEAVPWRCHRSLLGDTLLMRGIKVRDIISKNCVQEHELTSFAVLEGKRITYPVSQSTFPLH